MVEKARRSRVASDERGNPTPQWEVFVRNEAGDPMQHVGSVAAASATDAHEHASRLFGWYAVDMWVCPAGEVERFSTRGLESNADDADADDDDRDGGSGGDGCDGTDKPGAGDNGDEPRIYPETANASEVNSL